MLRLAHWTPHSRWDRVLSRILMGAIRTLSREQHSLASSVCPTPTWCQRAGQGVRVPPSLDSASPEGSLCLPDPPPSLPSPDPSFPSRREVAIQGCRPGQVHSTPGEEARLHAGLSRGRACTRAVCKHDLHAQTC